MSNDLREAVAAIIHNHSPFATMSRFRFQAADAADAILSLLRERDQWRLLETDPPPLDTQILASNGDDQESGEFQRQTYKNYVKCYPEAHDDLYRLEIKDLGTMWAGNLNGLTHWRLLPPPPAPQGEPTSPTD